MASISVSPFSLPRKGRVAAVVPRLGWLFGSCPVCSHFAPFCVLSNLFLTSKIQLTPMTSYFKAKGHSNKSPSGWSRDVEFWHIQRMAVLWLAKMVFHAESVIFRGRQYIIIHIWFFQLVKGQRILLTLFTPLVIFFPTECTPVLRWTENFVNFKVIRRIGTVCFDRFSFSTGGRVTSYSGEFRGSLFYITFGGVDGRNHRDAEFAA